MRTAILFALLFGITGCQLSSAKYPKDPQNTLSFSRSPMGGVSLDVSNGTNTDVVVEDVEGELGEDKSFKLGKATFKSDQSINEQNRAGWMDKMLPLLLADNERERIRGDNFERGVKAFATLMPTIASIIGGFNQVAIQTHRPGVVADLTNLLREVKTFDPSIVTDVFKNVGVPAAPSPPPSP